MALHPARKWGRAGLLAALVHRAPNRGAQLPQDATLSWVELLERDVRLAVLEPPHRRRGGRQELLLMVGSARLR
jgi:hypothetical protein